MARRPDRRGRPRPVHFVRRRAHLGRHARTLDDAGAGMSRVVVVTGAARGIGRACALALADGGWTVGVGFRTDESAATDTVEKIEATGSTAMVVHLDITDEASVQQAFRRITDELGNVTGLLNNAGFSQ